MKNIMKTTKNIVYAALLILVLATCSKKEEAAPKYKVSVTSVFYADGVSNRLVFSDGATAKIYNSETDFLAGSIPVIEGFLDKGFGGGDFSVTEKKDYYINIVQQGKYTNTRSNKYIKPIWSSSNVYFPDRCILTTNPTKLQVKVTAGGNLVSGARVTLYLSLIDYQNNIPVYQKTTGFIGVISFYDELKIDKKPIFEGTTDANGLCTFTELEPKEYWVKVSQGLLNNDAGVVKTTSALPDDIKATTTLNITLQ